MLTRSLFKRRQRAAIQPSRLALFVFGVALSVTCNLRAQVPSIQNGCSGSLSAVMAHAVAPYYEAVVALAGAQTGWCVVAKEHDASSAVGASMWEFVSAAFVLHAMEGRKEITLAQREALQRVLVRVPGIGKPPTRLRDIDTAFYVLARTQAAADDIAAQAALNGLQQHVPGVYQTLVQRSARWGEAGDN